MVQPIRKLRTGLVLCLKRAPLTILTVFISVAVVVICVEGVRADTLNVCPSGCTYTRIGTALLVSRPGDTVMVGPGDYYEDLSLRGGVRVQGAGADKTRLHGIDDSPVVTGWKFNNENVILDGFTIEGHSLHAVISFDGVHDKETLSNCVIMNSSGQWRALWICEGATPKIMNNQCACVC